MRGVDRRVLWCQQWHRRAGCRLVQVRIAGGAWWPRHRPRPPQAPRAERAPRSRPAGRAGSRTRAVIPARDRQILRVRHERHRVQRGTPLGHDRPALMGSRHAGAATSTNPSSADRSQVSVRAVGITGSKRQTCSPSSGSSVRTDPVSTAFPATALAWSPSTATPRAIAIPADHERGPAVHLSRGFPRRHRPFRREPAPRTVRQSRPQPHPMADPDIPADVEAVLRLIAWRAPAPDQ